MLYLPIGISETLALTTNDKIDLSEHKIGDTRIAVMCTNLSTTAVCTLDLDSNALSSWGGVALAAALGLDTAPHLMYLDIMCNFIGSEGAKALAQAMSCLPNLE